MTFFVPHGGLPTVLCTVRGGAGTGIHLSWFSRTNCFAFLLLEMSNGTAAETGHHRLLGPAQQVCFSRLERIASGLPCSNAGIFRWTHTSLSEKGQSCQKQRIRVPGSPSSFCFMHTEVPSPGLWHIPRSSLPMIAEAMGAKKGSLRNKNKCLSCVLTHRICLRNSNQMGTGGTQGLKAWTSYPGWHMQM